MKQYFYAILMCFLAYSTGYSKTYDSILDNSLVWEVKSPNTKASSYLLGTMHIMCEKDFIMDQRFKHAIENTQQLYLENDLDNPDELSMLQKSIMVEEPLKNRLDEEQLQKLSKLVKNLPNLTIDMLDNLHPSAIQSTILVSSLDCQNIKSMDMELLLLAKKNNIKVLGLDTAGDYIETINKVFKTIVSDADMYTYENIVESFNETLDAYNNESIIDLKSYVEKNMSVYPNKQKMITALLDNRNINWVENMSEVINAKPTVFAFGAAHLAGEFGVINLLREAGFTVTPILK